MKQILRYSFVALMAMAGYNANAQEVTIDFSGSTDNWGIGTTKLIEEQSFTYNNLTIKLKGTEGNGYRWYESGNIILGKQGATLTLPAFSFDVERIDIVGTSGASAAVKQNIYVADEAVSTETAGAQNVTNEYKIAEGKQAAGTIYTLKVNSNHNTQITKILIWKKGTAPSGDPSTPDTPTEINVAKALEIINALENGKTTSEEYLVKGFVVGTPDFQRKADETLYGNVNFDIADEKGGATKLAVFRAKNFGNVNFTEETISSLKEGDEVIVRGKLQKYFKNDVVTPEVTNCYLYSVNGTGIQAVKAEQADGAIYNLAGQRVEKTTKGVFIQNGKKFVVK